MITVDLGVRQTVYLNQILFCTRDNADKTVTHVFVRKAIPFQIRKGKLVSETNSTLTRSTVENGGDMKCDLPGYRCIWVTPDMLTTGMEFAKQQVLDALRRHMEQQKAVYMRAEKAYKNAASNMKVVRDE